MVDPAAPATVAQLRMSVLLGAGLHESLLVALGDTAATSWRAHAEALIDHFRSRGWKDYRPLLVEQSLTGRSELDAAIERDLLLAFVDGEHSAAVAAAACDAMFGHTG